MARKVPNGSAYFMSPRFSAMRSTPDDRPGDRSHHQCHECRWPAEKCADHRQHLHVAHAEPFFVAQPIVRLRDGEQDASADDRMPMSDESHPGPETKLNANPTMMPGSVMTFGSS